MAADQTDTLVRVGIAPVVRFRAVLTAMCLGVLIAQVDTSVVNLAVQPIGAAFGAPVAALQWLLDAYNLTYAVLLLTGGLIADMMGRRRAFMLGAGIMTVASLLCAAAPTIGLLVAGRALTGVGAALLLPASLAIVRVVWAEPAARGRALGVWASCNGLAFVIGPSLGGVLIAAFGWRSVFLMAVPLGLAALLLAGLAVPESADPQGRRIDLPGQALGAIAVGGLAFAAIGAHQGGAGWMLALALAVLAVPAFLAVERRAGAGALVPLDLFAVAPFRGAIIAAAAMTFGTYGMIFLLPLQWQATGGLSAPEAGLALMPASLVMFLVSTRSGALTQRFGARLMTGGGTAVLACGLLVIAATRAGEPLWLAEAGLLIAGLGMGINTGPLLAQAVGSVLPARAGTAAALINVARMTGATLGVALLGAVYAGMHDPVAGVRAAMLIGGAVQLWGAWAVWRATPPRA